MRCASVRCVTHQFDILQQLLTGFDTKLAVYVFIVVLQGIFGNTKLADNCLGRAALYIKVEDVFLLRCQRSKIIDKHLITVGIDGFQLLFDSFFQSSLSKVELLLCLLAFLLSLQLFLLRLLHLQAYLLNFILQGGKLFLQLNILVGGLLLLFLCLLQT